MHIFSGIYKSRKIDSPKGELTRPTSGRVREALFNICQGKIEGIEFLDLFAGSGAMGLEALSRGAKLVVFVDSNKDSVKCIKENVARLEVQKNTKIIHGDVFTTLKILAKKGYSFDVIFADPPYDSYVQKDAQQKLYSCQVVEELEKLISSGNSLLKDGGDLFLEDSAFTLLKSNHTSQYLKVKDTRKMGKAALQHWIYQKE